MKTGIYEHYKGGLFRVHFVAKHSEDLEEYVVYEHMDDSKDKFWIRPRKMFEENVTKNGISVPRFKFIRS